MTWIKFTVANSVQQMIVSCKTAKEAWDRLEKFLSPLYAIHVKNLPNKLRTVKKTSEIAAIDYLVMIRTTVDALATAGTPIPDEDIIGYTLDGLEFNYIQIQSTLQLQPGLTFNELLSLLIRKEDLIKSNQPPETPAALYVRSDVPRSGESGRDRGRGKEGMQQERTRKSFKGKPNWRKVATYWGTL